MSVLSLSAAEKVQWLVSPRSHMYHKWQTCYPSPDFLIPSLVLEGCQSVKLQVSPTVREWTPRIGFELCVSLRNLWTSAEKCSVHSQIKQRHILSLSYFFTVSLLCESIRTAVITQSWNRQNKQNKI